LPNPRVRRVLTVYGSRARKTLARLLAQNAFVAQDGGRTAAAHARKAWQRIIATELLPDTLVNDMYGIGWSYYNLACDSAVLGDADSALQALQQAIAVPISNGWPRMLISPACEPCHATRSC
jgi:hypothetical protein